MIDPRALAALTDSELEALMLTVSDIVTPHRLFGVFRSNGGSGNRIIAAAAMSGQAPRPYKLKAVALWAELGAPVNFPTALPDWVERWDLVDLAEAIHSTSWIERLLDAYVGEADILGSLIGEESSRVYAHLSSKLVSDAFARLESREAGVTRRLGLGDVFVDLPVDPNERGFIATYLDGIISDERTLQGGASGSYSRPILRHQRIERIALVGGPGQGKTTLGQYLCQRHRAAWLRGNPGAMGRDSLASVESLEAGAARDGLPTRFLRRFPFRVTLYRFAERLASGDIKGLEEELLRELAADGAEGPATELLALIFSNVPTLLVLDGLDEVPPAGNRDDVVRAVESFLRTIAPSVLDLRVIGTTRPQGYQGEWSDGAWEEVRLADLSVETATTYATRLLTQRHPADPDRRQEVIDRVKRALAEPETAGLGRSPLQVTILVSLLEQRHRAPRDRWRLFSEYFRVIFDRERERGIASVSVLLDHEHVVKQLHWEVGYRIHLGEEIGTPPVDEADLRRIVARLLESDGYAASARKPLEDAILSATRDRLVFLVAVAAGRVGFELRSLQEFAAAEYLADASDAMTVARFDAIAPSSHWRNVTHFFLGRIAVERGHLWPGIEQWLRDELHTDPTRRLARIGGRLALAHLSAGAGGTVPRIRSSLLSALELSAPFLSVDSELVTAEVHLALGERTTLLPTPAAAPEALADPAVWVRVLVRAGCGDIPAQEWARRHWVCAPFGSLVAFFRYTESEWAWRELLGAPFIAPPEFWLGVADFDHVFFGFPRHRGPGWQLLRRLLFISSKEPTWIALSPGGLELHCGTRMFDEIPVQATPWHLDWGFLFLDSSKFIIDPSRESLSRSLRAIASRRRLPHVAFVDVLPWPLSSLLAFAQDVEQLKNMADSVEEGAIGSTSEWQQLEFEMAQQDYVLPCLEDSSALGDAPARAPMELAFPFPNRVGNWKPISVEGWVEVQRLLIQKPSLELARILIRGGAGSFDRHIDEDTPKPRSLQNIANPAVISAVVSTVGIGADGDELLRELDTSDRERWLDWLATIGRRERVEIGTEECDSLPQPTLGEAFGPTRPGLLAWVAAISRSMGLRTRPLRPPSLPDETLDPRLLVDAVVAWLPTASMTHGESTELARIVASRCLGVPTLWSDLDKVLSSHSEPFLVSLAAAAPNDMKVQREVSSLLARLVERRVTGLDDADTARRLGLPLVNPAQEEHDMTKSTVAVPVTGPVNIERLALGEFRGFRELDLQFSQVSDGAGQWAFLAGDNGLGKTTILRGIVLALLPQATAQICVGRAGAPWVRVGTEKQAVAKVVVAGPGEFDISIRDRTVEKGGRAELPFFLVAYGSRRRSGVGGRLEDALKLPENLVLSLFDDDASLVDAQAWLENIDYRARANGDGGASERQRDAVVAVMKSVLDVDDISIKPDEVLVSGADIGTVEFKSLSDGYLTVAGWVIDMLARWTHRQRALGHAIPAKFNEDMTGVVIVDEIDLHLHPLWQHRLVESLRTHFPKMSFIVTTHNPVTLIGSRPGEVHVLSRDEASGDVVAVQRDLPPAASVDTLLTGDWFGLASTMDQQTLELLEEHRLALRRDPDSNESNALRERVAKRLGRPISTDLAHLAFRALAEVVEEDLSKMTAEDREKANERLKTEIRRRLAERMQTP